MIVLKYLDFNSSSKMNDSSRDQDLEKSTKLSAVSTVSQEDSVDQPPNTGMKSRKHVGIHLNLNPRFQMALLLTTILFVCFVPKGVAIVIDAVNPTANLRIPMMMSIICLYVYTLTFPFVLLKYVPNLREATSKTLRKMTKLC